MLSFLLCSHPVSAYDLSRPTLTPLACPASSLSPRHLATPRPAPQGYRPVQHFLETGPHYLVEALRGQDIDVIAEGSGLCRIRHLFEYPPEQTGDFKTLLIEGVSGNNQQIFGQQPGGFVLQHVIDKRDRPFGVLRILGHEQACPCPGRRRDSRAVDGR